MAGEAESFLSRSKAWLVDRRIWLAFAWTFALGTAIHHVEHGRTWLANQPDTPEPLRRPNPGGHGYTQIDFGGQWVMARMVVTGHGKELYHRQRQWEVVRQSYPVSDETPVQREETFLPRYQRKYARTDDDVGHDADRMMSWFMGKDPEDWKAIGAATATPLAVELTGNPFAITARTQASAIHVTDTVAQEVNKPAIGGPLYPPIQALLYAPLGFFKPQDAYYLFQCLAIGFALLAGRGITVLSGSRVCWPIATTAVLLYPGCRVSIDLSQNPTLSLCIVLWGWILVTRRREWLGGMVWGLFAFKPVWGMAFFLVPLLMGRWRVCVAMVSTGAALAVATLPFVGINTWFEWLQVGKEAADVYNRSENWIFLSRDLQGIPRRFLVDFKLPDAQRDTPLAQAIAWSLWGIIFASTVLLYRLRADRSKTVGLGAAFLFLGAWLTCYRFMYYDVLLSLVGIACLAAEPERLFRSQVFHLGWKGHSLAVRMLRCLNSFPLMIILGLFVLDNLITRLAVQVTIGMPAWGEVATAPNGATSLSTPRIQTDTSISYPWDTVLVFLLWAWCGCRLLRGDERAPNP